MSDTLLVRMYCAEHGSTDKVIGRVFAGGEWGRYVLDERTVIPPTVALKGDRRFPDLGHQKAGSWSRTLPLDHDEGKVWAPCAYCQSCGEILIVGRQLKALRARAKEAARIGSVLDFKVVRRSSAPSGMLET